MTAPIDQSNFGQAVDLLRKGFPALSSRRLETGLEKWMGSPGHRSGEEPIGYLLTAGSRFVGIGLTAVSQYYQPGSSDSPPRRRVNLASWYIEPEHRLRLPALLRRMLADTQSVYTDLTPAPVVLPILDRLGFAPINDGVMLVNLAAAACSPATGASVSIRSRGGHSGSWRDRMIEDHLGYGCLVLDLQLESATSSLVLKPARIKRVPLLEVIYCEDDDLLRRHIGAVARTLLMAGHFGMLIDKPIDRSLAATLAFVTFRQRRRRLARNATISRCIDHTYSELVFFE